MRLGRDPTARPWALMCERWASNRSMDKDYHQTSLWEMERKRNDVAIQCDDVDCFTIVRKDEQWRRRVLPRYGLQRRVGIYSKGPHGFAGHNQHLSAINNRQSDFADDNNRWQRAKQKQYHMGNRLVFPIIDTIWPLFYGGPYCNQNFFHYPSPYWPHSLWNVGRFWWHDWMRVYLWNRTL